MGSWESLRGVGGGGLRDLSEGSWEVFWGSRGVSGGLWGVSGRSLGGLGRSWGASGDLREPQEAPKYFVVKKLMILGSLLEVILG